MQLLQPFRRNGIPAVGVLSRREDIMWDSLVEQLSDMVSRRAFLKRIAQAGAALGLALVGLHDARGVVAVKCCVLCINPSTCTYGNCACEWCWTCRDTTDGSWYRCDECYSQPGRWCNNRTKPGCACQACVKCEATGTGGSECPSPPVVVKCSRAVLLCPPPDDGGGGSDPPPGPICTPDGKGGSVCKDAP